MEAKALFYEVSQQWKEWEYRAKERYEAAMEA